MYTNDSVRQAHDLLDKLLEVLVDARLDDDIAFGAMSMKATAERLGCSTATVRNLVANGRLCRAPGTELITKRSIHDLLATSPRYRNKAARKAAQG